MKQKTTLIFDATLLETEHGANIRLFHDRKRIVLMFDYCEHKQKYGCTIIRYYKKHADAANDFYERITNLRKWNADVNMHLTLDGAQFLMKGGVYNM